MLTEGMYLADRYEIVGKIGAGGMSDVYKAKDHTLGRFVAIKVLKSEFSDDVNFVTKFRTEAQSAAGLEHPNIVNIYDVGSENGMHYIVMEYVEGITLKTYIEKKGQLSFKEAVSIAIQVGRGIEAAHNKHIVHRDIKPQNIMISTEGKVKVMDFGIARAATSNTINSDVMGSVHYSSPEQARNGFVDGKSDIYSLGIVMYEMVTGRVPFDGDTTVAVAIQHLQEEMVAPSAYAPDLPISMEKIILKCTQKNPDRRYESMGDLLVDLKKALISPNEDFVVMVPVTNQDKTRVIEKEELDEIKKEANKIFYHDAEEDEETNADEDGEEDEDDGEEEGDINPKMEKAITIMGIVAGVVIVALIIYLIVSFFGLTKFGGSKSTETETQTETETETETDETEKVEMIDVTDMTYDEAKSALNKIGLGINNNGTVSSDTIAEGNVAEQDVEEGESVEKNTTINVKLSSGKGEVTVPNVVGSDETSANSTLKASGFKVSTQYEYNDTVAQGKVISQTPEANTSAKEDDTITIVVSQGVEAVTVPDVYNKTQDEATAELTNAGLVVSSVSSEYSDTIGAGYVISQSITAGKMVDKNTSITLVISLGPKVKLYKFSATIKLPTNSDGSTNENVAAAQIVLKDENGNKLASWDSVPASSFPYSIIVTDIENSTSGSIVITWLDGDGNAIGSAQTESVTFEAQ